MKRVCLFLVFLLTLSSIPFAKSHQSDFKITLEQVSYTPSETGEVFVRVSYTNTSFVERSLLIRGTALEDAVREDMFSIYRNGEIVPYVGPLLKQIPPRDEEYSRFLPGETKSSVVSISASYDFTKIGEYQIYPKLTSKSEEEKLSPVVITVVQSPRSEKLPPRFLQCGTTEQQRADSALGTAEAYANKARSDLAATPINMRTQARRYSEWFGAYSDPRWTRVENNFIKIASAIASKTVTFNCACDADVDRETTIAYVYKNRPYEVNLCPYFWRLNNAGTNSKAGTIIHEISHFTIVADTFDHSYGTTNTRALADSSPDKAVNNAESYQFFAENPGGLSMPVSGGSGTPGDSGGGLGTPGDDDGDPGIVPIPPLEEPKADFLLPILSFVLDGDTDIPDYLLLPEEPNPTIPERLNGKAKLVIETSSGSPWEGRVYEFDESNAYMRIGPAYYSTNSRLEVNLQGNGVVSGGSKVSSSLYFVLGRGNEKKLVPGVYRHASKYESTNTDAFFRFGMDGTNICRVGDYRATFRVYKSKGTAVDPDEFLIDFYLFCPEDSSSSIRGTFSYDASEDDAEVFTVSPNQDSSLVNSLPTLANRGGVFSLERLSSSGRVIDSVKADSSQTAIKRGYEGINFDILHNSTSYSIEVEGGYSRVASSYRTYQEFVVGRYENLLNSVAYGVPLPTFQLKIDGVDWCDDPVTNMEIHEISKESVLINRLKFTFDSLCQATGERFRGAIYYDDSLPFSEAERVTPSVDQLLPVSEGRAHSGISVLVGNSTSAETITHSSSNELVYVNRYRPSNAGSLSIEFGGYDWQRLNLYPPIFDDSSDSVFEVGEYRTILNGSSSSFVIPRAYVSLQASNRQCNSNYHPVVLRVFEVEYSDVGDMERFLASVEILNCGEAGTVRYTIDYDLTLPELVYNSPQPIPVGAQLTPSLNIVSTRAGRVRIDSSDFDRRFESNAGEYVSVRSYGNNGTSLGFKVRSKEHELELVLGKSRLPNDPDTDQPYQVGEYIMRPGRDGSSLNFRSQGNYSELCDIPPEVLTLRIFDVEFSTNQFSSLSLDKLIADLSFTCLIESEPKSFSISIRHDETLAYEYREPDPIVTPSNVVKPSSSSKNYTVVERQSNDGSWIRIFDSTSYSSSLTESYNYGASYSDNYNGHSVRYYGSGSYYSMNYSFSLHAPVDYYDPEYSRQFRKGEYKLDAFTSAPLDGAARVSVHLPVTSYCGRDDGTLTIYKIAYRPEGFITDLSGLLELNCSAQNGLDPSRLRIRFAYDRSAT